jgi:cell division protein FtsB
MEALPKTQLPPAPKLVNILVPVLIVIALAGIYYGWLLLQNTIDETKNMRAELSQLQLQIVNLNANITSLNSDADNLETDLGLIDDMNNQKQNDILLVQDSVDEQTETNLLPIAQHEQALVMQELLDNINNALEKTNADLSVITTLSAGKVDILNVDYIVYSAVINGSGISEDNIYDYARALRNSGQFKSVTVTTVYEKDEASLAFVINITW